MLQIYDSFEQAKKTLSDQDRYNIYLCGPTVYNYAHIGNFRPVVMFDVLHRYLLFKNKTVNYVHNITDIDDKIINQAQATGKDEAEISAFYTAAYFEDLERLNILLPTKTPKVTDYISEITTFIEKLLQVDIAYEHEGNVYFDISKAKNYGQLSHNNIEQLLNVRKIDSDFKNKKNPHDFLLWKKTEIGKKWPSPFGWGRPGWHTECVVFVNTLFDNNTLDIHGGGIDLIFPHHENENAQFQTLYEKPLSAIWWHCGHVNWNNIKMSKSLKNIILVKEFCEKYSANILRFIFLNHDQQQPLNLNEESIKQGINIISKINQFYKKVYYYYFVHNIPFDNNSNIDCENQFFHDIKICFEDNLKTTKLFAILEKLMRDINKNIAANDYGKIIKLFNILKWACNILGFIFKVGEYDNQILELLKKWEEYKARQEFEKADEIRSLLQEKNIL